MKHGLGEFDILYMQGHHRPPLRVRQQGVDEVDVGFRHPQFMQTLLELFRGMPQGHYHQIRRGVGDSFLQEDLLG